MFIITFLHWQMFSMIKAHFDGQLEDKHGSIKMVIKEVLAT